MAATPEKSARTILKIFAARKIRANEIVMTGALSMEFQKAGGRNAELADGLEYAIKQGWLEKTAVAYRLTDSGYAEI